MLGAPGLTGCSEQAPGEPGTEEGDPVSLRFSLYRAEADEASTRADAATDMADGKTFCIYAFPAGASTTTTEPLDHKVYTVRVEWLRANSICIAERTTFTWYRTTLRRKCPN